MSRKSTKNELIDELIGDIRSVLFKIDRNSAGIGDYQKFEEFMALSGIPNDMIKRKLYENGFESWNDFHTKKQLQQEILAYSSVNGALKGIGNAAIEHLTAQKDKD